MKFRHSAPGLLIASAVIVIGLITGVSLLLTSQMLRNAETDSFRLMRDVLASTLKATEEKALVRAELVTAMPAVRMAFNQRDRPKLLLETQDMFKEQAEKYGLDQAQFHVPPGVSFLRLHHPDKFGDDQTGYRPMLTEVNREKVLRKGIAITRAGPAITGIVPIFDDTGRHTGSFEMGLEFSPMLDKLKQSYGLEAAVFIDEKMLRDISTDLGGDVLTPEKRVGKYIRFHATHPVLLRALVTDRDVAVTDPSTYERIESGTPWGVQLVPVYNYMNKQVGVYALAMDFSVTRAAQGRSRVWQLLAALFGVVLTAGMILIVVRGLLLSPLKALNDRLAALADGDASQPADPIESYCDELKSLASSYERLRSTEEK
ncbi:MAG TPA: cache domain-containing protein [Polyangiaceae bacterium]|nr:cache domain-containing protein [Polyangiaceae bacterium]